MEWQVWKINFSMNLLLCLHQCHLQWSPQSSLNTKRFIKMQNNIDLFLKNIHWVGVSSFENQFKPTNWGKDKKTTRPNSQHNQINILNHSLNIPANFPKFQDTLLHYLYPNSKCLHAGKISRLCYVLIWYKFTQEREENHHLWVMDETKHWNRLIGDWLGTIRHKT